MERELDHPPPSQLSSTKRMIEVWSVTVIYEFRFSMGIPEQRLPRTVPATTKSVRVRGV